MPVPYLDSKPTVIPINTGRQLFVDNFLVKETNLESVYHTPNYYAGNPVLEPDKEWEKTIQGALYAAPFSDGIWYDDKDGKYKMWYLAGAGYIHKDEKQTFYTCYAESTDGKHWEKVNQDIVPGTNIVDTCNRDAATVWLDREEKDPSKRWKFFNIERRPGDRRWQVVLKYSADGIHWSRGVAQSGDQGDRTTAFYNPFTRKWALSMRAGTPVSSRSRYYIEHSDPEMLVSLAHRTRKDADDKFIVYWFTPDDKELRHEKYPEVEPGIYNFDAIPYESIMLGFYSAWAGPENRVCERDGIQKRNIISLGYSRDGFHFSRPSHTSTGLATLRRDGFVSMHAGKKEGYLTTETLSFDGKYLFVNADVRAGKLAVEVLDEQGMPIEGFGVKDCVVMRKENSTKQLVTWKNQKDLTTLKGKKIHLKFYLTNGDLYAFWISPWSSGESRGYTAGGGPGLNSAGIDLR